MSISSNALNLESDIVFRSSSDDLVELLNYIDKTFFKGAFAHLPSIWNKINISECHNPHTKLYYWFLKIREAIYSQDLQHALMILHEYTIDHSKIFNTLPDIDISKIFDLELLDRNSLNEEFLDFFCEQVMQVALQKEYPLESRIHYLLIGSSTFLDFGTNLSYALQYSQLAVSLAEQLSDEKKYYLAWAQACKAQALWKIGSIDEAIHTANNSLELFNQLGTGEFLGRFDAIKVLISLAVAQGRFDYAVTLVHFARANTTKTNVLRSFFLEFDLYIVRGSLDSARQVIDEIMHLGIPNLNIKWDTRFQLRELHLMMLEGFQSLVDRQIQALLKQPNLDNENKIQCYMLLADNFAYMHEYEQALSNACLALELAKRNSNPDKVLDIYRLMIDLGLRKLIVSEPEYENVKNDQWNLDTWFDEAYRIALERNVNITIIELQLYSILRQIINNDSNTNLKPIISEIQKECNNIKWIRGEKLAEKLALFIDSSILMQTIAENKETSRSKNINISLEEVTLYLKDLKASI